MLKLQAMMVQDGQITGVVPGLSSNIQDILLQHFLGTLIPKYLIQKVRMSTKICLWKSCVSRVRKK